MCSDLNFEFPALLRLLCCARKQPREQAAAHSWLTEHAEQPYTRAVLAAALKAVDAAIAEEEVDDNSGRDNGIAAGFVAHLEPLLDPVKRELQRGRPALCLELAIDLVNRLNDGVDDDQGSNYGEPGKFAEEIDALCVQCIAALAVQQPALSAAQIVRVRTRVRSAFNNSGWKRHRDYGWPDENVFKS
eukprot:7635-Heterococcus_DN1.PRE.2